MAAVTVRDISEETKHALKIRAAQNGRSMEAEIRAILVSAVQPEEHLKLGSALAALGKSVGGVELDITRDKTPAKPAIF